MRFSYKNYLLILLMLILAFNYVDRLAVSLVLQDIKIQFHLSDTQLGLLSGLAFALFYSVMGIPIGRWADTGNRTVVITVTTALWSGAVALCGYASSFIYLLLSRVGVAVGEAGCMPPAHSLIADYFPRAERPRAAAMYMQGSNLSALIGYFLAGWLSQKYGWQTMFKLLSLPGVVLAILAWVTLREPRRRQLAPPVTGTPSSMPAPAPRHSVAEVVVTLWNNVTFRYLWLAFSIMNFFSYGVVQWQPTYFIRTFGMNTETLGIWLTLIYGVGGVLGTYLGGMMASRYAKHNESLQLRATGWLYAGYAVVMAAVLLSPNPYVAIGLNTIGVVSASLGSGPLFGTIQTVVPERMRGMSISLLYLLGNLIGMGLGPLAAGAMSDFFRPWAGVDSLRYALLTLCPISLWGSWYLLLAARTVSRDVQAVTAQGAGREDPNASAAGYRSGPSREESYP